VRKTETSAPVFFPPCNASRSLILIKADFLKFNRADDSLIVRKPSPPPTSLGRPGAEAFGTKRGYPPGVFPDAPYGFPRLSGHARREAGYSSAPTQAKYPIPAWCRRI
jgi:hypothetical protein